MTAVIEKAVKEDRWAILDFANLVFSQAHQPHDFRTLLPKMYADGVALEEDHYLAREDGHIVGLTSALPFDICAGGEKLHTAYVGTVSTHLYRRGCGYMKGCMRLLHEDMEARGVQLFVLGGLRQRYGYYGYSKGMPTVSHEITPTNVEKAFGDVDAAGIRFEEVTETLPEAVRLHESQPYYCVRDPARYIDFMHSWRLKFFRVLRGDACLGFCTEGLGDIELYDEEDLMPVVKAWVQAYGRARVTQGLIDTRRNRLLAAVSESTSITNSEMVRVVDWAAVTRFFLKVRASRIAPLADGMLRLGIEGEGTLEIAVEKGEPACRMTDAAPDLTMSRLRAQEYLFSCETLFLPTGANNWLPLPGWIPSADHY